MTKPCAVYRVYSKDGRLLYIGASPSPLNRAKLHSDYKHWATEIDTIKCEWFATKAEAFAAEAEMIRSECPEWNVKHHISPKKTVRSVRPEYGPIKVATFEVEKPQ